MHTQHTSMNIHIHHSCINTLMMNKKFTNIEKVLHINEGRVQAPRTLGVGEKIGRAQRGTDLCFSPRWTPIILPSTKIPTESETIEDALANIEDMHTLCGSGLNSWRAYAS